MNKLEGTILSKQCMETILTIRFDEVYEKTKHPYGVIKKNKDLREVFELYFLRKLKQIDKELGSRFENDE